MALSVNITKRVRRRTRQSGDSVEQARYVVQWRDPKSNSREQRFFERLKEAQEYRAEVVSAYDRGAYSPSRRSIDVAEAVKSWLDAKRGSVRANTYETYAFHAKYITGPLLSAEGRSAVIRSGKGRAPKGARTLELIGHVKVNELTTRIIRQWHKLITGEVSLYSANKAKQILKSALALAGEEHEFRPPAMPSALPRREIVKKSVLNVEQVAAVIDAARRDSARGIYYAFPFLAGTRPSEQLGLLWDSVDFDAGVIHIRRTQLRDGSLSEATKTASGARSVPMSAILRRMLRQWRIRCPRSHGELLRVFPSPGLIRAWPQPRENGGGPLTYNNFRTRFWRPGLKRAGVPYVSPHSARHTFISTLQAQGVEVGLVAKLAGHKNASVTLGFYTHAVRGGEEAVRSLDDAYAARTNSDDSFKAEGEQNAPSEFQMPRSRSKSTPAVPRKKPGRKGRGMVEEVVMPDQVAPAREVPFSEPDGDGDEPEAPFTTEELDAIVAIDEEVEQIKPTRPRASKSVMVLCEALTEDEWRSTSIEEVLELRRSGAAPQLRCPNCGSTVRAHSASKSGAAAHFEHAQKNASCGRAKIT